MTAPVVEITSGSVLPVAMEAMSSFAYCGVAGRLPPPRPARCSLRSACNSGQGQLRTCLHSLRRVRSTPVSRHTPDQPPTG
jgi:hypothetical protein